MNKKSFGLLFASSVVPLVAYSQVYMVEDQVPQSIFPGEKFSRKTIDLSPDEIRKIEELSGEHVRNTSIVAWVGSAGNVVVIDQALGKHEFITYAVGISGKKTVQGIEIMEYRETYGYQIRNEEWRRQFVGKNSTAPLKLEKDIVNISGATLSSAHITSGVRRVLQTYEAIRARL